MIRQTGERVFERRVPLGRAWAARFRRLARDYERLPQTLAGLHFAAFAMLMSLRFVHLLSQSPYHALGPGNTCYYIRRHAGFKTYSQSRVL